MKKVLVIDSVYERHFDMCDVEERILVDAEVKLLHVDTLSDIPQSELSSTDAIILWGCASTIYMDNTFIDQLQQCRLIVKAAVGFENIDIQYAKEKNIPVFNIPDYGTEEVADHAMSLLLSINRKLVELNNGAKVDSCWDWKMAQNIPRLREKNLGIIGFGRIGGAVSLRAKAFGLNVSFYDPFVGSGVEKSYGVDRVDSLQQLLSNSDFISIHCDLNTTSHHLINFETISLFKKGVVLINTARGSIIETEALKLALKDGIISFAGLDVLENEPYIDRELIEYSNVITTQHSAFYSVESFQEMREKSSRMVMNFLNGEIIRNRVN